MADTFIFARHGQSQANADKIIADSNSPLTQVGIDQATEAGTALFGRNIDIILTSPFIRARQTAEIIASQLGISTAQVRVIEELRERGLGELENNPKLKNGLWYFTSDTATRIEPRKDTLARMQHCIELIKEIDTDGTVLVVGHAVSGYFLMQAASGKTSVADLDPPTEIGNADFAEVTIRSS